MILEGKAWKLGDNVDTDAIIPARYLSRSDPKALAPHCLEDLIPGFSSMATRGDMIVAGSNFGCGSSREHAPRVLKAVGISAVIARDFARIFYRNAFNIGLPVLQSPDAADAIQQGDRVRVELAEGRIRNLSRKAHYAFAPLPGFMMELIQHGGLANFLRQGGWT